YICLIRQLCILTALSSVFQEILNLNVLLLYSALKLRLLEGWLLERRHLVRWMWLLLLCLSWCLSLCSSFRFRRFLFYGYAGFSCSLIIQTCCNKRDPYIVSLFVIIESTKDNICILACKVLNIACCIVGIHKRNISGYIDDNMRSSFDGCFQKRTGYSLLNSIHGFV